ncbi:MAG TPA: hypothetical protein VMM59_05165, partial [Thermohalobaculum sp.]|nr:hypothetical protein [Thermohalobaculum sp.]
SDLLIPPQGRSVIKVADYYTDYDTIKYCGTTSGKYADYAFHPMNVYHLKVSIFCEDGKPYDFLMQLKMAGHWERIPWTP